jgi:Cys-tRNA(Pro)/Cys-tRNA(Cys) deacylase
MKTNAARILDRLGIAYELRDYEVDPEDLAAGSVAAKVGLPARQVFKTLVCRGERTGECFAVVPGDAELDLKELARAAGDRRMATVALKELQGLTGYIRGGVTVLGARKAFPAFIDAAALEHEVISVSAGVRGTQIFVAPADYVRAAAAEVVAALSRPMEHR